MVGISKYMSFGRTTSGPPAKTFGAFFTRKFVYVITAVFPIS